MDEVSGEDLPREEDLPRLLASDLYRYFPALYEIYKRRLFSYALLLAGKQEDAMDIVQETLEKAFKALAGFSSEKIERMHLFPWLRTIVHNSFVSMQRKRKIEPESYDTPEGRLFIETVEATLFEQPEIYLEHREMLQELYKRIRSLPQKYRTAVVLKHIMQLPYTEIADALDIPVQKAKGYVATGIKKLRSAETSRRCL